MNKQSKLFEQSQPVSSNDPRQTIPRLISPDQSVPKQRKWKFPALSTTAVLIVFGLVLEMWASPGFQPSTFFATRGGQLQGKKALVASEDEAKGQAHIKEKVAVAEADVNFAQDCRINRQQRAHSTWSECMSSGTETSFVCDTKQDQINSIACPDIPR